ncbi:hypothetical protein B7P43_G07551 [Cryptotermes secundus]|nr:hypothetical protein B7P43_G07551 [Cryptotermes secundus]
MLLPCTVRSIMPKQVTLQLPLPGSNITHVKSKDLCSVGVKDATQLGLVDHQGLMSQVVKVYGSHECPHVTTKLSQCWDYSTEACVSLLCSFWQDYDKIAAHMKEQGNPLANLVPGDRVTGEVVAVENCGAVVRLENGIQGIATPELYKGPLKCGAKVEGTVLFIDFLNQCVELTLCHGIMKRINTVQDGKLDNDLGVGTGVRGEVLSVRQEMIVIVLKGAGRKQLAYLPSRCHMNDLVPDLQQYRIGETSKMIVQALVGGRIICLQQKFVFKLIKLKARAAVAAESAKRKVDRTSQHQKSELSNGNRLGTSEQELNTRILPRVKRHEGAGYDSCEGPTNDDACVSEPENETKSGEESSDEDETAFLRRLEAKAMKNYYGNSTSNEVQETSHNSDDYITEQEMKQKKRKMHEEGIIEDCEETYKKKMKTTVRDELLKELKDIDHEGGCNSGVETLIQRKEIKELKNLYCGQAARLSVSAGFVWDADPSLLPAAAAAQKSDSSSDEEEVSKTEGKSKKLSRVERREQARQEEERLRAIEQKLMDSETGPQSADDFDRLVLSSPNNSMCWIKYMAFHLQATEIEKARAIAHRALNTISFREEQEKLNVWCALLNLENLYGTKESLDKVLEEALQMNDPFKVHTQMLQIYADSGKSEEAEKLVSLLTKKFRDNKQAWLQGGEVLLKLGKLEKARSLMQRAITNLDKKLHVEIISKFAHLENQLGEPERAQTLMEHILTSYPKRVDIWSSYVDMLVKNGQLEAARQVLERGVAQKLPARRMKSLFAKFLRFEEHHGTPEGMEKVRQMAVSYVETTAGRLDDEN